MRIVNGNKTIKEVSEITGIAITNISLIEKGVYVPRLSTLQKFTKAYNVTPSIIHDFDERQTNGDLDYQQTLYMILQHYLTLREEVIAQKSEEKEHSQM